MLDGNPISWWRFLQRRCWSTTALDHGPSVEDSYKQLEYLEDTTTKARGYSISLYAGFTLAESTRADPPEPPHSSAF